MISFILYSLLYSSSVYAQLTVFNSFKSGAPVSNEVYLKEYLKPFTINKDKNRKTINNFCLKAITHFKKYGWKKKPCGRVEWRANLKTQNGNPLVYSSFGTGKNVTLYFGGVHPDELTPIHLAFKFARYLRQNPAIYRDNDIKIIVAPLVNPDAFFVNSPTRTNANGVDVNRNFLTIDWYDKAVKSWKKRGGLKRYFPGKLPNTEVETLFQAGLVRNYKPRKIISIHAPLGFLDYDGPGDQKSHLVSRTEKKKLKCSFIKYLRKQKTIELLTILFTLAL